MSMQAFEKKRLKESIIQQLVIFDDLNKKNG